MITANQQNRIATHWGSIANEAVEIHATGGPSDAVYGFASEAGCLRIKDKMNAGRVGYSRPFQTWYYVNQ